MISRTGNDSFFSRHYDWIIAGIGLLALLGAGGYFAMTFDSDVDAAASEAMVRMKFHNGSDTGVEKFDIAPFASVLRQVRSPALVTEVSDRQESFLASERRVKCACGAVIPGGLSICPACQKSLVVINQVDEEAKRKEQWKKRFGVEIDSSDADGDGFTNEEEYAMKSDPTDAKNHADYLDSLQLQLPLKQTFVPFYLKSVNKIPAGYRCNFVQGRDVFNAVVGENIVIARASGIGKVSTEETGFRLVSAENKERKVEMAGVVGSKTVDASIAIIERISDGKRIELIVPDGKPKLMPVDVQATLLYVRGGTKTFDVVTGSEIDLNGAKYKVVSLKVINKGAEITFENQLTGKKRLIKALE